MTGSALAAAAPRAAAALPAGLYFRPLIIAGLRRAPDLPAVAVISILRGRALAGRAATLAMALHPGQPGPGHVQATQGFTAGLPPRPGPPPLIPPPRPAGPGPGPGGPGPGPGRRP